MPDSIRISRIAAASLVVIACAVVTVAIPRLASAATPLNSTGARSPVSNRDLIWGIPVEMAWWGLAGVVAIVVGLIVASMPARRFKAAADAQGMSALVPEPAAASTVA